MLEKEENTKKEPWGKEKDFPGGPPVVLSWTQPSHPEWCDQTGAVNGSRGLVAGQSKAVF